MDNQINILIVEDHLSYAQGMQFLLQQNPKINEVNIAIDRNEALVKLEKNVVQIVLLDLQFDTTEYNGFTIAKKIKQLYPEIKIMVLTQHARKGHHRRLFDECGVDAYLDKKLGIEETYLAIDEVLKGNTYIDKSIQQILDIEEFMKISSREREVLEELCEGQIQKQIADTLSISPKTVEVHVRNLFKKFRVKNSTELIARYIVYRNANRDTNTEMRLPFKK